jgi:DNA-binding NarL/FixJ family response regulator
MTNQGQQLLGEVTRDRMASDLENFTQIREAIRLVALKQGISENKAICQALSIGYKELAKGQTLEVADDINVLSARQYAVLKALRKGLAVKEIADTLQISEVTVRTHIQRIRTRLGCSDLLRLRIPDIAELEISP